MGAKPRKKIVEPDLDQNCLLRLLAYNTSRQRVKEKCSLLLWLGNCVNINFDKFVINNAQFGAVQKINQV